MNPHWLLNENFPLPAVRLLRDKGWDVAAIAEDSPSVDDEAVMARAQAEGRWLATFDRDYGELVFRKGLPPPKLLLLLRAKNYRPEEPAEWLLALQAAGELREGFFHIFDGQVVRRRPLLMGYPGGAA
jgi:predicted nuclease of predicted toxin-antitoxin system